MSGGGFCRCPAAHTALAGQSTRGGQCRSAATSRPGLAWAGLGNHSPFFGRAAFALVVFLRILTADISDIMWKNHRQQMGLTFSQCSYMAVSGLIFSREQNITSRPHNRSNHCSLGFSSGQQSALSCQDNRPTGGTWQLTEPPLATIDWFLVEFWLSMKVWPMWSF